MLVDLRVGSLTEPLTGRSWDRPAVVREFHRRRVHYGGLGLAPSDRVFLHHGNTIEFFVDLLAIWSLGGCAVPIDSRLTAFEVETLARAASPRFSLWDAASGASVLASLVALGVKVLDASTAGAAAQSPPSSLRSDLPCLDEPALILFTSGTTGQPKGVVHTHRSLRARWMSLRHCLGLAPFRRTLCLLPTHFGHGLICNCLFPWLSGQDLFVMPPFRADVVMQLGAVLDRHAITCMSSVPALWRLALKTAKPPARRLVERVLCGSAPLSASLWREIQEWAGTPEVLNAYGITETASWVAGTTVPGFVPEDGLIGEPWGAVGKVLRVSTPEALLDPAQECAPGESGYVWLNTPALMRGYLDRPDLTRRVVSQGWFMTGDIGVLDERGLLSLRGREREEINKGGTKIYPEDIDAVMRGFGGVADICTFGYEDPFYGEEIGIAVVVQGAEEETLRGLYRWAERRLASHQLPLRWYVVEAIPHTSSGKTSRAEVAAVCARLAPVDVRRLAAGR